MPRREKGGKQAMDQYHLTIEVRQEEGRVLATGIPAGTPGATVPAPRTVETNAHVAAAAYLMKHADSTALAVVDGYEPGQAVGVITAADVAQVIADGMNVNDVRIYELMIPKQLPRAD
jgi:CBS domain-containing protein